MTLWAEDLLLALDAFHLLRPLWLLLVPPVLFVWWRARLRDTRRAPRVEGLAPHLRRAMTVGRSGTARLLPIDGVALALLLLTLGAAGPSWTRQVDPFLSRTGPLVIVLKVTPSMEDTDVAPTRLERAKFKIRDLLDLRAGARTALVAYAGTAHRVLPYTEDTAIVRPYLEGLEPAVMPEPGDNATAAIALARDMLATQQSPGGILVVMDTVNSADLTAFTSEPGQTLGVLAVTGADATDTGLAGLSDSDVDVVTVTADDSDVRRLDRRLNADYRRATLQNSDQPWEDRGWWLAWPAALICLFWFRRGWTMRWALVMLALPLWTTPARADGIADWFLTPDQQGQIAYRQKHYARAAELFVDPMWKGYALYRDGQYDKAAEVLARLDTPEAAFTQGMAHIRNRAYRDGVRAFEHVLELDPDYPGAAENLETARQIVDYIETTREQSDTGEEAGIGADDVRFDNEANRGTDTETEYTQRDEGGLLTADQWMNTIDTGTGDFLAMRFRLEAAQANE